MKGVVVQVGEPKSIVLLNSGKITAVPTPQNAHVGMEITVKISRKFKILVAAAVLIIIAVSSISGIMIYTNLSSQKQKTFTEEIKDGYSYMKGIQKNIDMQNRTDEQEAYK